MITRILIFIIFLSLGSAPTITRAQSAEAVTLNLSCRDASLREVLRGIAVQHGVSLAGLGAVTGNVTIHLEDVSLEDGLRALLEPLGFTYENRNNIYFIQREVTDVQRVTLAVTDGQLTISANNADVNQVIRLLNIHAGINVVATPNLVGNITAHLTQVPLDDAIPALFVGEDFVLNEVNGIYQVASRQMAQTPGLTIFITNEKVSIFAHDASLTQLLAELADRTKINLATVGNVERRVTLRLGNKTLEEVLNDIALMTGNTYRQVGDIHFIGKGVVQPGETNPLLERKIIWLKHLDAQEISSMLPADIPRQSLTFAPDHNAIILLGTAETIEKTEQIIAELDIDNAAIRTRKQPYAISIEVASETGRLTVDIKDAPIQQVVRELSIQTGIDLLILGESRGGTTPLQRVRSTRRTPATAQQAQAQVAQQASRRLARTALYNTVSLRLADATLEAVLSALLKGTGYTYKLEQHYGVDLYIVGTGELTPGGINPLVTSKLISLNYLDVTKVTELLPVTVPDANITVIPDQNAVMIMGVPEMVSEIEAYLREIDRPTPQVMIQVYLLELTHGSSKELGISFDGGKSRTTISLGPGLGLSFDTLERVPEAFGATLNALVNENHGRVLSSPLVAVVSGETATINVGVQTLFETTTEIYRGVDVPVGGYTRRAFNTIETGIQLEITPWIGAAGEITMAIKPNIRDADLISREKSTIAERSIDTVIRVKDQGMIIIGGLLQEKELVSEDKIPLLGHLPLLGGLLFTRRNTSSEQTELIVIIQPKIIR